MPKKYLEPFAIHVYKKCFSARTVKSMINAFIHVKITYFNKNIIFFLVLTDRNLEEEIKITKKNIIESKTPKCRLIYQNKLEKIQTEIMRRKEQIKKEEKFSFIGLFSYAIEV